MACSYYVNLNGVAVTGRYPLEIEQGDNPRVRAQLRHNELDRANRGRMTDPKRERSLMARERVLGQCSRMTGVRRGIEALAARIAFVMRSPLGRWSRADSSAQLQ